jgi:hypothetical protein
MSTENSPGTAKLSPAAEVALAKERLLQFSIGKPTGTTSFIQKRPLESVAAGFVFGILAGTSKTGNLNKILTGWALRRLLKTISRG